MTDNQITKSPRVYNDRAAYNRAKAAYQRTFVQFQKDHKWWRSALENAGSNRRRRDGCLLILLLPVIWGLCLIASLLSAPMSEPIFGWLFIIGVAFFILGVIVYKPNDLPPHEKERRQALFLAENPEPVFDEEEPRFVPDNKLNF